MFNRILTTLALSSLLLLSACTTLTTEAQTVAFDGETVPGTHQLTITTSNAQDTNAVPRNGSYTIRMLTSTDTQWLIVTSTGTLLPDWLAAVDGQVTLVRTSDDRWAVNDDCISDASGFPLISMRDIFGPLQGYTPTTDDPQQYTSTLGNASWSRFASQATITDLGLTSVSGTGTGRILLPFSEVIQGDIAWEYQWSPEVQLPIRPTKRCTDALLDSLILPDTWQNRRFYGGTLYLESNANPQITAQQLLPYLQDEGWDVVATTIDSQREQVIATRSLETIQAFFVSNSFEGTDITIIAP